MYVFVARHMHMQTSVWLDVDECATKNGGCDVKRKCTHAVGGRTCGNCPAGYANNGVTGCKGLCVLVDAVCFGLSVWA